MARSPGCPVSHAASKRVSRCCVHASDLLVDRPRGEVVERVRRPTLASGRRAGQHEAIDPLGPRHRQLLGDHPAEADAEHVRGVPSDVVEQGGGVAGEVRHGRLALGHRGAPEAALVVDDHLEVPGEGVDQEPSRLDGCSGAVDEQQAWALATALPVEVDLAKRECRHRRIFARHPDEGRQPRGAQVSASRRCARRAGRGAPSPVSSSCLRLIRNVAHLVLQWYMNSTGSRQPSCLNSTIV